MNRIWISFSTAACSMLLSMTASAGAPTVTYIYTDGLNSPVAEADCSGNIIASFDYTPFGVTQLGAQQNGPGFTGHVVDPDTSLVYMQARYYDPWVGQFLSVDPQTPSSNAPPWNAFAYASNNPATRVDLDGRRDDMVGVGYIIYVNPPETEAGGSSDSSGGDSGGSPGGGGSGGSGDKKTLPSMDKLWEAYPHSDGKDPAHPSSQGYQNQCAIRLSFALQKAGVDMSSYPRVNVTKEGFARSAKNLADWLTQNYGKPQVMSHEEFRANYWTEQGIFFEMPPPGNYAPHIDLIYHGQVGSGFYKASQVWYWKLP